MPNPHIKLSFQQIEIFLAAAKYENITLAAKELFITQPAVSRTITAMEETLGIVLFTRYKQRIHLTEAGTFLFQKLSRIQSQTGNILDEAYAIQQNSFRHISLADTNVVSSNHYLRSILDAFRAMNPSVELTLERIDPYLGLHHFLNGKYDAYIMHTMATSTIKQAGFNFYQFLENMPCIALAPEHPMYHETNPDFSELCKTAVAVVRDEYGLDAKYTIDVSKSANLPIDMIKYVPNMDTIGSFVATGKYIAIGDKGFLSKDIPNCRYIELKNCTVPTGMGICWSPNNKNRYLQQLVNICKELTFA